ncbi:ABC-type antimicrobial peptide transport system, permease component [Desulfocapsa sulfexigens DSM 10523]|uniref:ABC-type antimicrobial peptide transport system, permease component n=1 Tax=Desulfocapsa sulfexigens (strain DSM 10523 / SB164P1) TaxID=1167006 RepID=M1P4Z4_DESSD|nr:ABC transporter permease [Desulfocapsa sulfexigens]AGF78538.1 ABC-type antimicrobial peptide transport system, permease component [Desulfocapsa sulfexigens DSM 10523]
MRTTDLIRISSRQVLRQYRKNIGVIVTIILGTAGFIIMITMGRSIEENISHDLEIIGNATRIRILFKHIPTLDPRTDKREFKQNSIDGIKAIPGVDQVSSIVTRNDFVKISHLDTIGYFQMLGVDESFWKVHGSSTQAGILFSEKDLQQRRPVCILGQRTAHEIFNHLDPIDQFITINNTPFKVIGVLDAMSMPDKARTIFLPITTAQDRINSISPVNKLYIRCYSWDDIEDTINKIPLVVKKYQPNDEIEIFLPEELLARIKAISFGVKIFVQLALIATFVLGGIGIWNIMMMAVRSRTREIGLKKAIGAEDHDILFQFLAESLMLSIGATFIGFMLGWTGVTFTASILHNSPPKNLFWLSTGIGFSFSLILGIVAGLAPAIKASRMEVVTALRYE